MTSRRDGILREMGLAPLWRLRGAAEIEEAPVVEPAPPEPVVRAPAMPPSEMQAVDEATVKPLARFAPPVAGLSSGPTIEAPAMHRNVPGDIASLGWDELDARIRACDACELCQRRKQAVPGVGDRQADWLFVGEGPGAEEDARGEPFVGQAGRLLDKD